MRVELPCGPKLRPDAPVLITGRPHGGGQISLDETPAETMIGIGGALFSREFYGFYAERRFSNGAGIENFEPQAPGSVIVVDRTRQRISISTDLAGCFPLYVGTLDDRLVIADRLSELNGDGVEPDWLGAIQYLRKAFTVGTRTLFQGVRRIRPGERCEVVLAGPSLSCSDSGNLWASPIDDIPPRERLGAFCAALRQACDQPEPVRLMMSGGWDSRLLLAACLSVGRARDIRLYFHGDTGSREASVVRRIATDLRLPVDFVEIGPEMFSPDQLASDFAHFESVSFPHWHHVRSLDRDFPRHTMAGIFGEVVGGHYGPPMVQHGWRKLADSLAWVLTPGLMKRGATHREGLQAEAALSLFRQAPYSLPWYMNRDAWYAHFDGSHEAVEADITAEMRRYESRGLRYPHEFIEAFITEHRGAQMIAAQLHSASGEGRFNAPFAHRAPLEIAAATPFGDKALNRLSQAAIRALYPRLLDYPTAATLLKASRPVALLEGSRVLRKSGEALRRASPFQRNPRAGDPIRLSWVRFGQIAASSQAHEVIDSLTLPLWDRVRMHDSLTATTPAMSHAMIDMLMKIKTLDLALGNDSTQGGNPPRTLS